MNLLKRGNKKPLQKSLTLKLPMNTLSSESSSSAGLAQTAKEGQLQLSTRTTLHGIEKEEGKELDKLEIKVKEREKGKEKEEKERIMLNKTECIKPQAKDVLKKMKMLTTAKKEERKKAHKKKSGSLHLSASGTKVTTPKGELAFPTTFSKNTKQSPKKENTKYTHGIKKNYKDSSPKSMEIVRAPQKVSLELNHMIGKKSKFSEHESPSLNSTESFKIEPQSPTVSPSNHRTK
jgi:hypothetical protein